MSSSSPAWFRQHFNADYRTLYADRTQQQADDEVAFVVARLCVTAEDHVLDLCCGHGRHLRAFAALGIPAVGVDLSHELIVEAPSGPDVRRVCADMRRLPFAGDADSFSVLASFFTSFGYFEDDEENAAAAREMARVMRPGARFVIDLMNPRSVIGNLVPYSERTAGPFEVTESRSFDTVRRRVEKRIDLLDTRTNERRHYVESVRVYEENEARDLLALAGLEVVEVVGDFQGSPSRDDSPRLLMMGRHP